MICINFVELKFLMLHDTFHDNWTRFLKVITIYMRTRHKTVLFSYSFHFYISIQQILIKDLILRRLSGIVKQCKVSLVYFL